MGLKEDLKEIYGLTEDDWLATENQITPLEIKENELFLKEDSVSDRIAFIKSGLFRSYLYNERGDEITTHFFLPGQVLISIESFNDKTPSQEGIIACVNSELLIFTKQAMDYLCSTIPAWQIVCKGVAEIKHAKLKERNLQMQTLNATERYKRFIKENPLVIQKVALTHIASYLGIDLATLSRIRKKI